MVLTEHSEVGWTDFLPGCWKVFFQVKFVNIFHVLQRQTLNIKIFAKLFIWFFMSIFINLWPNCLLMSHRGRKPSAWVCSLCGPTRSQEGQLSKQPLANYGGAPRVHRRQRGAAEFVPESLYTEQRPHVPIEQIHSPHCLTWPRQRRRQKMWWEKNTS